MKVCLGNEFVNLEEDGKYLVLSCYGYWVVEYLEIIVSKIGV